MAEPAKMDEEFDVGGVRLPRPFSSCAWGISASTRPIPRPRAISTAGSWAFASPTRSTSAPRLPPEERGKHGPGIGYFTRHGTDHHSFVLFPRRVCRRSIRTIANIPSSRSTR